MFFGSTDLSNISFVVSSTALKLRKPFPVYRAVGEGSSQVRDTVGPGGQRRGNCGCPDWIRSLGPDPGRFLRLCCRVPAREPLIISELGEDIRQGLQGQILCLQDDA